MILDLPTPIHCGVQKMFLTNDEKHGIEECYIFAVTILQNRTLLFTCHTENGAVYSRLPIWAFKHNNLGLGCTKTLEGLDKRVLCPWSCLGDTADIVEHSYLKDYEVQCSIYDKTIIGRYLATIDYSKGLYAQDPEQHKTHNIVELENGFYAALPNNYCKFEDEHFTKDDADCSHYRRNKMYWRSLG